jgi:hypothetical protein
MCSRSPLWSAVHFWKFDSYRRSMLPEFGGRASADFLVDFLGQFPRAKPAGVTTPQ